MIHYSKRTLADIRKEYRFISRHAGMICSRIVLLCCLFLLFFTLRPTSVYLCAAFAFFPAIITGFMTRKKTREKTPYLESCAKKYHFTYHRYLGEKYTGNLIPLSLMFWQFMLTGQNTGHFLLQKAPGICMFLYLMVRIIVSEVVKRQIDHYYGDLECLSYDTGDWELQSDQDGIPTTDNICHPLRKKQVSKVAVFAKDDKSNRS